MSATLSNKLIYLYTNLTIKEGLKMIEITAKVKSSKTGEASKADIAKAEKLTAKIIAEIGKPVIAKKLGIAVNNIYRWKLIPAKFLPVFCAVVAPGTKMEELRPDTFTYKA